MRFSTDDDSLEIRLELDTEPEALDLTANGLGDELLQIAAREMQRTAAQGTSPSGRRWASNAAATIGRKGHSLVGVQSGQMLDDLGNGTFDVDARSATWTYPKGLTWGRAHGFHNGRTDGRGNPVQPARPLIGWTNEARRQITAFVAAHADLA